ARAYSSCPSRSPRARHVPTPPPLPAQDTRASCPCPCPLRRSNDACPQTHASQPRPSESGRGDTHTQDARARSIHRARRFLPYYCLAESDGCVLSTLTESKKVLSSLGGAFARQMATTQKPSCPMR